MKGLLIEQFALGSIPAVTDQRRLCAAEFNPGEVMQRLTGFIHSNPGHTGGIDETGPPAVAVERDAITLAAFQLMVHVAEDHKISPSIGCHAIEGDGQVPVSPVDMGPFPVTTAGAFRIGTESCWSAVSEHHEGPMLRSLFGSLADPFCGLCFRDRSEDRLDSLRKMKSPACTAWPGPNDRQWRLTPGSQ